MTDAPFTPREIGIMERAFMAGYNRGCYEEQIERWTPTEELTHEYVERKRRNG